MDVSLHPVTWARDILDPSFISRKDAEVTVSVMWAIWTSRNKYTHGEVAFQPRKSMELVDEFIRSLDIPHRRLRRLDNDRRVPPEPGWTKINVDGALDCRRRVAGLGMIARNHVGFVLSSCCRQYCNVPDPFTIELLACRDAMALA
jgi:hypothetical protein